MTEADRGQMGLQCVSERCDEPMDPRWAFCPRCGEDNREPRARTGIDHHVHLYAGSMSFCVHCGAAKDRIFDLAPVPRTVIGTLVSMAGAFAFLAAVGIQIGHGMPQSAFGRWVEPWYTVQLPDRTTSWSHRISDQGAGWTFDLVILGAILLFFGALMLVNRRSLAYSQPKPYEDD